MLRFRHEDHLTKTVSDTVCRRWPLQQTRPVGVYLQGTASGAKAIDTSTAGPHTFPVTATDAHGTTTTAATHYTVSSS